MDVKKKLQEIADRSKADESFNQMMKDDFEGAMRSCGVSSVSEFARELVNTGMLSEEDLSRVSGGTSDTSRFSISITGLGSFVNSLTNWIESNPIQISVTAGSTGDPE